MEDGSESNNETKIYSRISRASGQAYQRARTKNQRSSTSVGYFGQIAKLLDSKVTLILRHLWQTKFQEWLKHIIPILMQQAF
jgi:hypothetical protein